MTPLAVNTCRIPARISRCVYTGGLGGSMRCAPSGVFIVIVQIGGDERGLSGNYRGLCRL